MAMAGTRARCAADPRNHRAESARFMALGRIPSRRTGIAAFRRGDRLADPDQLLIPFGACWMPNTITISGDPSRQFATTIFTPLFEWLGIFVLCLNVRVVAIDGLRVIEWIDKE